MHISFLQDKAKLTAARKNISLDDNQNLAVVDIMAGDGWEQLVVGRTPCLTKSRAAYGGFYLWSRKRLFSLVELGRMQGTELRRLDCSMFTPRSLGAALGNAMTRSVLDRVIPRLLFAAKVIHTMPEDRWASKPLRKAL